MNKVLALAACLCLYTVWTDGKLNGENPKYSNIWVAKVRGGEEVAKRVAKEMGYTYNGQVGEFNDYYELVREDHPEVSLRDSDHLTDNLLDIEEVVWAKQQMLVRPMTYGLGLGRFTEEGRLERILKYLRTKQQEIFEKTQRYCNSIFSCLHKIPTDIIVSLMSLRQGDISKLGTFSTEPAPKSQLYDYSMEGTKPIGLLSRKLSAYAINYNDPFWTKQWNMQDYRTEDMPVMDHNVVPAHKMGYTGKGVTVTVVDNGVEHECPEYRDNFIAELSYDMCEGKPGSHPTGHSHGTNCAGVIAMKPNNNLCGVGIAYDASIIGVRAICDVEQVESATAKALIHNFQKTDIYSNSWGYYGLGKYVIPMDKLTEEAFKKGATEGRNRKGAIYVKGAGNDRHLGDNCATDPELNHQYVLAIAGADQWGKPAYYSEGCTAVFATTYTLGKRTEGIVAPELNGGCYTEFSGTSASCPQASALIALALEANPELTYRDVMHLIAMSAEVAPLADNKHSWYKNGRGFFVSNDFGFGLMNAENMVTVAKDWVNVPQHRMCVETVVLDPPQSLSFFSSVNVTFDTLACKETIDEINYLEHIELASLVSYPYRGHIMVSITSPAGTTSKLLEPRPKDNDPDGLEGWSVMSTHNWGEGPRGKWSVVYKISSHGHIYHFGHVNEFTIKFHGTKTMPEHYKEKRVYAAFRLPNGQTS